MRKAEPRNVGQVWETNLRRRDFCARPVPLYFSAIECRLGGEKKMTTPIHGNAQGYDAIESLIWSAAEKVVARKGFDLALQRELEAVMVEAKKKGQKHSAAVRPLGLGAFSDKAAYRNRPPVRL